MFKFFRFSIVAIVAIATFQVPATTAALAKEKWVYVGSDSLSRYYVDTISLKRNGNFAWFWSGASVIVPLGASPNDRLYHARFVTFYESIDCRSGATRIRNMRSYDKNQNLIPKISGDFNNGGLLGPGDRNHPVTRYICRR